MKGKIIQLGVVFLTSMTLLQSTPVLAETEIIRNNTANTSETSDTSAIKALSANTIPNAETPNLLPTRQTLRFNSNSTASIGLEGNGLTISDKDKNTVIVKWNSKDAKIILSYKKAAVEILTGRELDLTLTISDFYFRPNEKDGQILVGGFVNQNVTLIDLYAVKETMHFSYNDTNDDYKDMFYLTTGSLNFQRLADWQKKIPSYNGASRFEFSSPVVDDKFIATYLPKDSEIQENAQQLYGSPSNGTSQVSSNDHLFVGNLAYGYMGNLQHSEQDFFGDGVLETYTKFGITYHVKNGFSFYVGTSGREKSDPQGGFKIDEKNNFLNENNNKVNPEKAIFIDDLYNHAIVSFDTAMPYLAFQLDISKVDNFSSKALAGASFTLTQDDDKTKVKTIVSGSDGKLSFDTLIPGKTYTLAETKVPEGYANNNLSWKIMVPTEEPDSTGNKANTKELALVVKDDQGKNLATFDQINLPKFGDTSKTYQYKMEVRNIRKGMLPATGGSGNTFYYIVAAVSIGAAASIYGWTVYRNRKEWV